MRYFLFLLFFYSIIGFSKQNDICSNNTDSYLYFFKTKFSTICHIDKVHENNNYKVYLQLEDEHPLGMKRRHRLIVEKNGKEIYNTYLSGNDKTSKFPLRVVKKGKTTVVMHEAQPSIFLYSEKENLKPLSSSKSCLDWANKGSVSVVEDCTIKCK